MNVFDVAASGSARYIVTVVGPFAGANPNRLHEGKPELDEHGEVSLGNRIKAILQAALAPVALDVIDESHLHASHTHTSNRTSTAKTSSGTHYRIRIVSEAFRGKSRIRRHRAIYRLLCAELKDGLHALTIEA
jgi:BolA family transcriptional regulator, general stress-responsive regulator